jgi:nitrogen regulatory protein PII
MPMKLLVIVTNERGKVEEVFKEFLEIGVGGATVIDTQGMARILYDKNVDKVPIFGSLKMLIDDKYPFNKTIFVVLDDDLVKPAIQAVKRVLGDLTKPNVGIIFVLPVEYVEGGSLSYCQSDVGL